MVAHMFGSTETNFLSLERMMNLNVQRGDNILDSCFQYAVVDEERNKLLNIKMYDKMLDLLSREGIQ